MNRTLIVYASRHGTTVEYAKKLFELLDGNVDLCFLNERESSMPDLSVYDTFVIGGSIHYGKNNKLIIDFTKDNLKLLKAKRLGLFVTSYFDGDKALEQLNNAYPEELLKNALVSDFFDGELLYPKMNFWERLIAKAVLKAEETTPIISKSKITQFAERLNDYHHEI